MKKLVLAVTLALAAITASALDLGVTASHQYGTEEGSGAGVTIGKKFDNYGLTAGFTRSSNLPGTSQDRYSVEASYDLLSVKGATVAATTGLAYLDNKTVESGVAGTLGVSVSYPVYKNVSVVGAYQYQAGDTRVIPFNGSQVVAGLKYSF